jgi:type II secretory pathway component PulM
MDTSLAGIRQAFNRLSQQEQLMILLGGGVTVLVGLLALGWGVSSAITRTEHRVKVKTDQLAEVVQLQGEYKARERETKQKLAQLTRNDVRLVSLVEDVARQSGVEIGQLRPEESEPTPEGIIEARVDLRASNLSVDRLEDFLERLDAAPGVVVVRRLKVNKPYRRDTLNIEMTVTTYKRKES